MQRSRHNTNRTTSTYVVSLDEVVIFAERGVFFGFLQFSKSISKTNQNMIYESIAANVGFLQVTFISR